MHIQSDSESARTEISAIADLIVANGGYFDPNLCIECNDNRLSVTLLSPSEASKIIIKVPSELLVPSEPLHMQIVEEKFSINPDVDELSSQQIELGYRMVELFNATGKVLTHKETCPWISFRQAPELIDTLLVSRTLTDFLQDRVQFLHELPNAKELEQFACESFISSRVILHEYGESANPFTVFMPIIDCLNHDSKASDYLVSAASDPRQFLQIAKYQPQNGSTECFVNYGSYDCIDSFLNHGFIPNRTSFVRSIPLEIEITGVGKLIVNSLPGFKNKKALHRSLEDIRKFVPAGHTDPKGNLVLSHLLIPGREKPRALPLAGFLVLG